MIRRKEKKQQQLDQLEKKVLALYDRERWKASCMSAAARYRSPGAIHDLFLQLDEDDRKDLMRMVVETMTHRSRGMSATVAAMPTIYSW